MSQLILDAGAFVAFERGEARFRAQLAAARRLGLDLATTAPVVTQVWRNGRRQALLATLLAATRVDAPGESVARRAGELLANTKTDDAVDALLVLIARDGDTIVTSDPDDIRILVSARGVKAAVLEV